MENPAELFGSVLAPAPFYTVLLLCTATVAAVIQLYGKTVPGNLLICVTVLAILTATADAVALFFAADFFPTRNEAPPWFKLLTQAITVLLSATLLTLYLASARLVIPSAMLNAAVKHSNRNGK